MAGDLHQQSPASPSFRRGPRPHARFRRQRNPRRKSHRTHCRLVARNLAATGAAVTMLESEFIEARERGSRRLLIALHGLGDSIEGYRWLPNALSLPWLNYLLVNAPDEYYGGYSSGALTSR